MIADVKKTAEQKMKKTLETLKNDLGKVRTGRVHTGLLDHIVVDYYGTPMPIPQVANVTLIDARTIGVTPWEKKMAGAIEKAIRDSDLGLNPATQGEMVRVDRSAQNHLAQRPYSSAAGDSISCRRHLNHSAGGSSSRLRFALRRWPATPSASAGSQAGGGLRSRTSSQTRATPSREAVNTRFPCG